jgi:hypothetical protein
MSAKPELAEPCWADRYVASFSGECASQHQHRPNQNRSEGECRGAVELKSVVGLRLLMENEAAGLSDAF